MYDEFMDIQQEILLLTADGNLGNYKYCRVVNIFLLEKRTSKAINYFTHIGFETNLETEIDLKYITNKPETINEIYQIGIIEYTMTISEFKDVYQNALKNSLWIFKEKVKIEIDAPFYSPKKFIKNIDPTGGKNNVNIPIEWELYGSNFMGNYYVSELFSKKECISKSITKKDIVKIQTIIDKYKKLTKLKLNLIALPDRIGNILCKFKVDILKDKPVKLGNLRGIEIELERNDDQEREYTLAIFQTHDGLIYKHDIDPCFHLRKVTVEPNQMITQIMVTDNTTKLILFAAEYDYTFFSNYFATISPETMVSTIIEPRLLVRKDKVDRVNLSGFQMLGSITHFIEQNEANLRNQKIFEKQLIDKKYLCSYLNHDHQKALSDIIEIISGQELVWDLQEVWVIDPYLTVSEIIYPLLHCKKQNITIKCMCSYQASHQYTETKNLANADTYTTFKESAKSILDSTLSKNRDLKLEYRSIYDGYGMKFHDRYIILKFEINSTRVWSLGASINSIGKSHSIMQIVSNPEIISDLFVDLWEQTENEICLIYKNNLEGGSNETKI